MALHYSVGYSVNVRLLLFNEAQSRECAIEFGGRQGIAVMLVFSQECFLLLTLLFEFLHEISLSPSHIYFYKAVS